MLIGFISNSVLLYGCEFALKNIIYARCSPLCHSLKMDYSLIAFVKPLYLWFLLHRNSRGMPETTRERIKKDETTEVIGTLLMPPQPLFERHSKSPDWMELMLFCSPAAPLQGNSLFHPGGGERLLRQPVSE